MTPKPSLSRLRPAGPFRGVKGALITSTVVAVVTGCAAPEGTSTSESTSDNTEQRYLDELKDAGTGTVIIPNMDDEAMIAAGQTACELYDNARDQEWNVAESVATDIDNGFSPLPQLSGFPDGYSDDRIIAAGAVMEVATANLCPEHQADSEREFKSMSYLSSY